MLLRYSFQFYLVTLLLINALVPGASVVAMWEETCSYHKC